MIRIIAIGFKVLWDFNIGSLKPARRSDIIFVDKRATDTKIIDTGIPGDARVNTKELDKKEK